MTSQPFVLTAELQQAVSAFFQRIPFNQVLGIQLDELSPERVLMSLPMRDELIGNFVHGILHGGVIASLLDVAGGAMALIGAFDKHRHLPSAERMARLSKLGTIDLRIDYLRPCVGEHFELRAEVLRLGSRVASVRMEFLGADGKLLCTGAGAYIVS